jgi:hypothetical protein
MTKGTRLTVALVVIALIILVLVVGIIRMGYGSFSAGLTPQTK